jgi:hypothetical protein
MTLFLMAFLLITGLAPGGSRAVLSGWVSDAACGARHAGRGGADCIRKCIRGGEHINPEWKAQPMVLVAAADRSIWTVENPKALAGYEGREVRVWAGLNRGAYSVQIYAVVSVEGAQ